MGNIGSKIEAWLMISFSMIAGKSSLRVDQRESLSSIVVDIIIGLKHGESICKTWGHCVSYTCLNEDDG